MSKNKIVAGLIILIVVVGGWMLFKGGSEEPVGGAFVGGEEPKYTDPKDGEIAVTGKLGCLPLKSGETPTGDECIIGLSGNDGKFYALDTSRVEVIEKGINLDTEVQLVGTYAKADTSNEESNIFRYDGVLSVRVMQNQSDATPDQS